MTTQATEGLRYETKGGTAWLVIDRPQRMNAMSFEMWQDLRRLVERAQSDTGIRALVVTGAGERAFCAGADISQFGDKREGEAATRAYDAAVQAGCAALVDCSKPSVALIRGVCFGGGFGLAMSCDIRLAQADCRFRVPAARLGLGYSQDGIRLLAAKLGISTTADLMLSARIVAGEEALQLGIVSALWSAQTFQQQAEDYLARLASNAPLTLRAVKQALADLMRPEADRDKAAVDAAIAACFDSADYREGRQAFQDKRDPVFKGA